MKNLLVLLFCYSNFFANGQKTTNSLGLGIKMRFPFSAGSYSSDYRDIGPNLQASLGVTKLGSVQIELSSLFINIKNKTVNRGRSLSLFQAGYRSHFLNSGFFVQADGGLVFWGKKNGNESPAISFIGGVGGGYSFVLSSTSFLDISPSANIMFNTVNYNLINSIWVLGSVTYRCKINRKKIDHKK